MARLEVILVEIQFKNDSENVISAAPLLDVLASHKDTFLVSLLKLLANATRAVPLDAVHFYPFVSRCVEILAVYWAHATSPALAAASPAARDALLRTLLAVVRMGTFQALARQAADATAALQSQASGSSSSGSRPAGGSSSSSSSSGSAQPGGSSSGGDCSAGRKLRGAILCGLLGTTVVNRCVAALIAVQNVAEEEGLPTAATGRAQDGGGGSSGSSGSNDQPAELGLVSFYRWVTPTHAHPHVWWLPPMSTMLPYRLTRVDTGFTRCHMVG